MSDFTYRVCERADLPALGDLRWRLKTDDAPVEDPAAYDDFLARFVTFEGTERSPGEAFHWAAETEGRIVAAMSVIVVRKLPAPDELDGRWGYLTNCYALPEVRNSGVGSGLLAAVKAWAVAEHFELLVVWPSDRAFSFYRRAGFVRPGDPLVLHLSEEADPAC
jgi:GNAT superfamily N-acetyltransferase